MRYAQRVIRHRGQRVSPNQREPRAHVRRMLAADADGLMSLDQRFVKFHALPREIAERTVRLRGHDLGIEMTRCRVRCRSACEVVACPRDIMRSRGHTSGQRQGPDKLDPGTTDPRFNLQRLLCGGLGVLVLSVVQVKIGHHLICRLRTRFGANGVEQRSYRPRASIPQLIAGHVSRAQRQGEKVVGAGKVRLQRHRPFARAHRFVNPTGTRQRVRLPRICFAKACVERRRAIKMHQRFGQIRRIRAPDEPKRVRIPKSRVRQREFRIAGRRGFQQRNRFDHRGRCEAMLQLAGARKQFIRGE